MACDCAKLDSDSMRYKCFVSGDDCLYMFPNDIQCAIDYGEGTKVDFIQNLKNEVLNDEISINKLKEELNVDIMFARKLRKKWLMEEENKT